jgi:bifunctional non-homologous end joining protein LigD
MPWRTPPARSRHTPPAGFIQPCQPTLVANPPAGRGWLHEVKHDGFRILARKQGEDVALWTRHGTDFAGRFPKIAEAVGALPVDNALIDGEAVAFLPDGHSDFAALRTKAGGEQASFVAFDLLSLEGDDLRQARSRSGGRRSRPWSQESTAFSSTKPWRPRARSYSPTPAGWVWRESCRSAP